MNSVLILYPSLFQCYEKFERKVLKILSKLDNYSIVTQKDYHHYIKKICNEKLKSISFYELEYEELMKATHAVIFDDGEEYPEITTSLINNKIPLRVISIKITRVINIKIEDKYKHIKSNADYEYIGRGSKWGNPYSMHEGGDDRDEVIRKFKYDFDFDKFPHIKKEEANSLSGKRLGCFCKPASCHGDVIAEYLNSLDDGN
ncbi:DUF4326 domain-containing protein [Endozoicomonas ascidiicola]|uniref:DUF4326 domain-containing protein n=1 Tax=Endozoicomonas ascidiicola TaxID=1698521 RepID=UPI000836FDF8|nr:DUF4326 domain-containing protein [Endozoicomonas ascidiicola]